MHRWGEIVPFVGISAAVAGCPKGRTDFNQGRNFAVLFPGVQQCFLRAAKRARNRKHGSATLAA
jgi:hypothetical protein